jgi:hypothetical protein
MLNPDEIMLAARAINEAVEATARDFAVDDVAGEEDFTGQLLGRCKATMEHLDTPGTYWRVAATIQEREDGPPIPSVRFSARQTVSKGPSSEESWSGADLLMVLEIKTDDYEIRKGVLVQAKRLEHGEKLTARDARRLREQCKGMLDLTADSFVFVYSTEGVTTLSATAVEGSKRDDLHSLEQWPNSTIVFFMDFLKCWTGDSRLKATDHESLAVLRALSRARNAMLIKATEHVIE